jgi:hypothetical protein
MRSVRGSVMALLGTTVLTGALVGCGGGAKDNGVAAKSANDILTAAKSAVHKAGTVHIVGSGSDSTGHFAIDMRVDVAKDNAIGSFTSGAATVQIIRTGSTAYVKAPASFYTAQGAPAASAQQFADKWVKVPSTSPGFANLTGLSNIDQILAPASTITKGSKSTVDGNAVIALIDEEGTLYVSTTGDPVPRELVPKAGSSSSGKLVFTDFGASVDAKAPSGAITPSSG